MAKKDDPTSGKLLTLDGVPVKIGMPVHVLNTFQPGVVNGIDEKENIIGVEQEDGAQRVVFPWEVCSSKEAAKAAWPEYRRNWIEGFKEALMESGDTKGFAEFEKLIQKRGFSC